MTTGCQVLGMHPTPALRRCGLAADLAERGVRRMLVGPSHVFPERIDLHDGKPGAGMLMSHWHLDAPVPWRGCHATSLREGARVATRLADRLPEVLQRRIPSLRAFDEGKEMLQAVLARITRATDKATPGRSRQPSPGATSPEPQGSPT